MTENMYSVLRSVFFKSLTVFCNTYWGIFTLGVSLCETTLKGTTSIKILDEEEIEGVTLASKVILLICLYFQNYFIFTLK